MILLFCHMVLSDPTMEWTCEFAIGTLSTWVNTVPSLILIGLVEMEIIFALCHLVSRDLMIKVICYLVSAIPSTYIITMTNFMLISLVEVETNVPIWSHCITWPHDQTGVWFDWCKPFNLSHHAIKIGDCKSCWSKHIFWFFHVSLQGYFLRGMSVDFT